MSGQKALPRLPDLVLQSMLYNFFTPYLMLRKKLQCRTLELFSIRRAVVDFAIILSAEYFLTFTILGVWHLINCTWFQRLSAILILGAGNTKGGSITVPFTSCLTVLKFRISCMTTDKFCYLQNRLMQTNQTGGHSYSDTSPLSIPWREKWTT